MKKKVGEKIKGRLDKDTLEVLALPKDTLAAPNAKAEQGWTAQDIREALLENLLSDSLGDMLQNARKTRKVTGEHLGKRMGVSKARVAQLEALKSGQVELQTLTHFAHALGYQVNINFIPQDKKAKVLSTVL
jgi:DNA-binding Xre family transcriptional regulator